MKTMHQRRLWGDFEWADLSRYRSELMGLAILFVILFHVDLPRWDAFYGLRRMGNIGVDIFLFLSGIGLWFSFTRNPSVRHFFRRRYLRVYPAWFIVACLYYIPRFHGGSARAWIDLAGDLTINWDFWLHDEPTFWYIPATMMLYLFTPAYIRLIQRHPVYRWLPALMMLWCVAVQYVVPLHAAVGHIEIFWSRVPIYFIGINIGARVQRRDTIDRAAAWLIGGTFTAAFALCIYLEQQLHGRFPLFIERMVYIPLTVSGLLLSAKCLGHAPTAVRHVLAFVGTLSLEIYLLHVRFALVYLPTRWSYWPTVLACVVLTLPMAWLLEKIVRHISGRLSKMIKPV